MTFTRPTKDQGRDLKYSDGIAGARTTLALKADAAALQRRLPGHWELTPYDGNDLRGTSLRGANVLVPFMRSRRSEPMTVHQGACHR
jgi:hypothetical protein